MSQHKKPSHCRYREQPSKIKRLKMSEHNNKSLQVKKQVSTMKGLKMYKQMSQKTHGRKDHYQQQQFQ